MDIAISSALAGTLGAIWAIFSEQGWFILLLVVVFLASLAPHLREMGENTASVWLGGRIEVVWFLLVPAASWLLFQVAVVTSTLITNGVGVWGLFLIWAAWGFLWRLEIWNLASFFARKTRLQFVTGPLRVALRLVTTLALPVSLSCVFTTQPDALLWALGVAFLLSIGAVLRIAKGREEPLCELGTIVSARAIVPGLAVYSCLAILVVQTTRWLPGINLMAFLFLGAAAAGFAVAAQHPGIGDAATKNLRRRIANKITSALTREGEEKREQ